MEDQWNDNGYGEPQTMPEEEPQGFQPDQSRDVETQELKDLFIYADNYRQQFEADNLEYYRLYMGYRERPASDDGTVSEGSNIHIPFCYEQIDTFRSRQMDSVISSRPYIDMSARLNRNMDRMAMLMAEEKAKLAAANIDFQLELNKYPLVMYQYLTDLDVFQAAIMSVGWKKETRKVRKRVPAKITTKSPVVDPNTGEQAIDPMTGQPLTIPTEMLVPNQWDIVEEEETVWDDNELRNVDFFDFWFDPRAKGTDLDLNRFVFHRDWMTWDELTEYLQLLGESGNGTVYDVDKEQLKSAGSAIEEGVWKKLRKIGLAPEDRDGSENQGDDDHLLMFEVLHYWEDTKHKVLVNRDQLAYTGENPYWRHGKKPFVADCFEPVNGQPYGKSGMQVLHHLQDELDTTENQFIDNVSMAINNMWKVLNGADIDETELVSRPNGVIHVDNMEQIQLLEKDVVGAQLAMQHNANIAARMENALPTPPVSRGMGTEKTATVSMINNDNSTTRYKAKLKLLACSTIQRLGYLMDCNNQQFMEEPRLIKMFDQEGIDAWKEISVDDIMGEHDYTPAVASVDSTVNKMLQNQQLAQIFPIASQDPDVNQYAFKKAFYSSFDSLTKEAAEFLNSEEEVKARQAQEQQMRTMQMQGQQQALQQQNDKHSMGMVKDAVNVVGQFDKMAQPSQPPMAQRTGGQVMK